MFFCQCCAVNGLKGEFKRNYCSFSFLLPSYLPETEAVLADIHCLFILILLNIFFVNYVYMKCQKFLLYLARLPFFSSTGCTVKGCSDYSSVLLWRLFFFFFSPKVLFLGQQAIYPWLAHTQLLKSFPLTFFLIILPRCPTAPLCASEKSWNFNPLSAELL